VAKPLSKDKTFISRQNVFFLWLNLYLLAKRFFSLAKPLSPGKKKLAKPLSPGTKKNSLAKFLFIDKKNYFLIKPLLIGKFCFAIKKILFIA
jgi:hypothetical protein